MTRDAARLRIAAQKALDAAYTTSASVPVRMRVERKGFDPHTRRGDTVRWRFPESFTAGHPGSFTVHVLYNVERRTPKYLYLRLPG